jgi:hypothetical protein
VGEDGVHLARRPLFGILYQPRMMDGDECVVVGDCLCVLVVRVPGYRYRGPGSIPGATRFAEK